MCLINNNFNLNVYLNETCKDAMNLTDFIKQITIEYKDLDQFQFLSDLLTKR